MRSSRVVFLSDMEMSRHIAPTDLLKTEQARARVNGIVEEQTFSIPTSDSLPSFGQHEVQIGRFLGKGAFCRVEEILSFTLTDDESIQHTTSQLARRQFLNNNCQRLGSGDARYAIKHVHPNIVNDEQKCLAAIVDLLVETRFLLHLEHPHIIKLRGNRGGDPFGDSRYFLILDRLNETLRERISSWQEEQKSSLFMWRKFTKTGKSLYRNSFTERISKAFDLSSAIAYMHSEKICHRDIKPNNIGFDIRGDIKIFDFGLSKEIPHLGGSFHLTCMTGSLRYMAPENAMSRPYNESCDVYSFAILLWEMLACTRPYDRFTDEANFTKAVFVRKFRPRVNNRWCQPIQATIRKGWDDDWKNRPSMVEVERVLREELIRLRGSEDNSLDKNRRRSTNVYKSNSNSSFKREVQEALLDGELEDSGQLNGAVKPSQRPGNQTI